jgi:DNA-binding NarL/FixJ family response regulator
MSTPEGIGNSGPTAAPLRVVLAEDSVILRDGLVALLVRRGHEVMAAVGEGRSLERTVDTLVAAGTAPDVVVADIRMPPSFTDEGLQAVLALRGRHRGLPVLLFSQYLEARYASRLLAGDVHGVGYLLKDRVADVRDFLDALTRVAGGQTVLDPEVVSQLMARGSGVDRLTPREKEVLELMAQGRSNGAIAERLCLSYGAVEKNVSSIFSRLGLEPDAADHRRVLAVLHYLQG